MATRKQYTFSQNGVITRNICLFPSSATDDTAAVRHLQVTDDEFQIQQLIDCDNSGDINDDNIGGSIKISETLAEIRYGPPDSEDKRCVQVKENEIIIRHGDAKISLDGSTLKFYGNATFESPVQFLNDVTVKGLHILLRGEIL